MTDKAAPQPKRRSERRKGERRKSRHTSLISIGGESMVQWRGFGHLPASQIKEERCKADRRKHQEIREDGMSHSHSTAKPEAAPRPERRPSPPNPELEAFVTEIAEEWKASGYLTGSGHIRFGIDLVHQWENRTPAPRPAEAAGVKPTGWELREEVHQGSEATVSTVSGNSMPDCATADKSAEYSSLSTSAAPPHHAQRPSR